MSQRTCGNHPDVPPAWWCQGCEGFWCAACAPQAEIKPRCPRCGSRMVSLQVPTASPGSAPADPARAPAGPTDARPGREKSFYARLPAAFVYPLKGPAAFMIAGWAVVWLLIARASLVPILGLVVGGVGLVLGIILPAYLCAYMLELIGSSARGDEEPPDWPDLGDPWGDVIRPALLVGGTVLVAFLPAWGYMAAMVVCAGQEVESVASTNLFRLWIVLGALVLPMGLLSVALEDSLRGWNPVRILVSIVKVPGSYALTCGLLAALLLTASAFDSLPRVPVVGPVLSEAVSLYLLMVEMRLIGLLYHAHRLRLNWFDEVTDRSVGGKPRRRL